MMWGRFDAIIVDFFLEMTAQAMLMKGTAFQEVWRMGVKRRMDGWCDGWTPQRTNGMDG